MKKHSRILTLVLAAVLVLALALPVSAAVTTKHMEGETGINIFINSLKAKTTDVTGKEVEAFASDGTTYVPIRAVSEALGYEVNWDSPSRSVVVSTEGNNADNDAAYLSEYFGIPAMSGTVSVTAFNGALSKLGATAAEVNSLTPATAAKAIVAAANMTEIAKTYTAEEVAAVCTRLGNIPAADQIYVACAVDANLIPAYCDFNSALTGDTASVILMNAAEAAGKARRFIGFTDDADIAARLQTAFDSFTVFDNDTLNKLGTEIVSSGVTTGYNLKYAGNDARFLSLNTIKYGHDNITHAIQLVELINRKGLVARVQLEPKVSVYEYMLEWSDGVVPDATPTYVVKPISSDKYAAFAVEYDLLLEFSCAADRDAFDAIIEAHAKKYDDNPELTGLIASSWWQPLYSTTYEMRQPQYKQINDVVIKSGDYSIHPFATNEAKDAVIATVKELAPGLSCEPIKIWCNAAFYRYITGTDHQ